MEQQSRQEAEALRVLGRVAALQVDRDWLGRSGQNMTNLTSTNRTKTNIFRHFNIVSGPFKCQRAQSLESTYKMTILMTVHADYTEQ
jgi:hypothetical protein